jgi:hypothetical protein
VHVPCVSRVEVVEHVEQRLGDAAQLRLVGSPPRPHEVGERTARRERLHQVEGVLVVVLDREVVHIRGHGRMSDVGEHTSLAFEELDELPVVDERETKLLDGHVHAAVERLGFPRCAHGASTKRADDAVTTYRDPLAQHDIGWYDARPAWEASG